MSGYGSIRSVVGVMASIRKAILSDNEDHGDVVCLENPEIRSSGGASPSVARDGPGTASEMDPTLQSKSSAASVEQGVQQRRVSCSMELTESASLTSVSQNDTAGLEDVSLISQESMDAATEEIKRLMDAACVAAAGCVPNPSNSSPTLEELTVDLLKPRLSEWLNENLHGLVKDIVEKEISKMVARLVPGVVEKEDK